MSIRRPITCIALCAATFASFTTQTAQAGPLIDWLFGHHRAASPAYPVGPPVPVGTTANMPVTPAIGYGAAMPVTSAPVTAVPLGYPAAGYPSSAYAGAGYAPSGYPATAYPATGYAANYGNYYGTRMPVVGPSGYGYPAMQPNGITAATAPTIMSYVPDYRTTQNRAPVTYYRPLMTTDPNTGAQVVALAPCTSYEYQTQRVPTFGYNGVLGSFSTPPVVPAPQAMPTYTLPSGGVPVAGATPSVLPPATNSYAMGYGGYSSAAPVSSVPSYSVPGSPSYSSNYGAYSPQQTVLPAQPGLTAPPMSAYPTQPIGGSPGYYGSVSGGSTGGSTGSYAAPTYSAPTYTPGLSAPQGPTTIVPTTPLPSTQYQSPYPSTPSYQPATPSYQPSTPSFPVNPAPGLSDPSGDVPPVLPPNLGASNRAAFATASHRAPTDDSKQFAEQCTEQLRSKPTTARTHSIQLAPINKCSSRPRPNATQPHQHSNRSQFQLTCNNRVGIQACSKPKIALPYDQLHRTQLHRTIPSRITLVKVRRSSGQVSTATQLTNREPSRPSYEPTTATKQHIEQRAEQQSTRFQRPIRSRPTRPIHNSNIWSPRHRTIRSTNPTPTNPAAQTRPTPRPPNRRLERRQINPSRPVAKLVR